MIEIPFRIFVKKEEEMKAKEKEAYEEGVLEALSVSLQEAIEPFTQYKNEHKGVGSDL